MTGRPFPLSAPAARVPAAARRAGLVVLLALAGLVVGLAASLPLSGGSLGTVKVSVPRCTTGATTMTSILSGISVVSVTINSLPAACGGATIQAAVNNGTVSSSGSATVPAGGGSVTVALAVSVAIATNTETDILLTGP
jgi:hypothetical protein